VFIIFEHYFTKMFIWATFTHIIAPKGEVAGTFTCRTVKEFLKRYTRICNYCYKLRLMEFSHFKTRRTIFVTVRQV